MSSRPSPRQRQAAIAAERKGIPFVLYRDGAGRQVIFQLDESPGRVTVGRRETNDIALDWDGEVSRAHAELVRMGGDWTISDDGLSRNGTFLNGTRITGRRRLHDGDDFRVGRTLIGFRDPREGGSSATYQGTEVPTVDSVTDTQRRVLIALCRPYTAGSDFATPATNQDIASEVYLSIDAVKNHLRVLFNKFGIAELPQNIKRARLAEYALQWGVVAERDL